MHYEDRENECEPFDTSARRYKLNPGCGFILSWDLLTNYITDFAGWGATYYVVRHATPTTCYANWDRVDRGGRYVSATRGGVGTGAILGDVVSGTVDSNGNLIVASGYKSEIYVIERVRATRSLRCRQRFIPSPLLTTKSGSGMTGPLRRRASCIADGVFFLLL